MKINLLRFRLSSWLSYQFKARHYKGFGIHSPFVFFLVRELFWENHAFYAFEKMNAARSMLLRNRQRINVATLGAPSVNPGKQKTIRKLVAESSFPDRYGKLLFRLINFFTPETILELGTGSGLATLSLAFPHSKAKIISIDGNAELHGVAKNLFEVAGVKNVELFTGSFRQHLPVILKETERVDFVLFDGDHRYKATLDYFEMCLTKAHNDSVFVFDDIHWSPEMEEAWSEIIGRPEVTVSIDLFRIGIVFFRKECTKQHYMVRY